MEVATSSDSVEKLARLQEVLRSYESVLICYSGGIDSALILAVASQVLGKKALGITAVSASLPASEREEALRFANTVGAEHEFVESNEIEDPNYSANNPDRCFHCKTELYTIATREAGKRGFATVASGVIVDDLGDYRPGIEAAKSRNVKFPLVEAGFRKTDVRAVAAHLGLSNWDKPAAACLSSRLPYGTAVTRERLAKIGGLEHDLKGLGFRQLRVRYHELQNAGVTQTLARIEIDLNEIARAADPEIRSSMLAAGKKHGFSLVTLDLAGYRTGSHNDVLEGRKLKIVGQ